MYLEVTGDLFADEQEAIGHGCNCQGVMGAGFARLIAKRWPESMLTTYKLLCERGLFKPGQVMISTEKHLPVLYNLATQDKPGPNAQLWAIVDSVRLMLKDAEKRGIKRVAIPQIGCGIGGLDWEKVKPELKASALDFPVTLVVYFLA